MGVVRLAWSEIFNIPFDTTPYSFHLHGLGDLQIGSESTSLSIIRTRIKEIVSDPCDSGIMIPGDLEDEDRPSTRIMRKQTFAGREEVIYRDAEKHMAWLDKTIVPLLLPLQKTKYGIMAVLAGHHWTQLSPVLNSVQYICNEISRLSGRKVPYMGEMSCFLDLRFKNGIRGIRKVIHLQHGEGGGQTKSSSLLKLDRTSQGFIADCYVRAHDCQIVACKSDQLYPKEQHRDGEPEIMSKTVTYLNLGSSTQGYNMNLKSPSYIESKMMRPTTMGWGTLKFNLRKSYLDEDRNQNLKCDVKIEI